MALFGERGGTLVSVLILASVLGALNANTLVGPRIAYAMALDGVFFAGSERVHDRFRTPHVAILGHDGGLERRQGPRLAHVAEDLAVALGPTLEGARASSEVLLEAAARS